MITVRLIMFFVVIMGLISIESKLEKINNNLERLIDSKTEKYIVNVGTSPVWVKMEERGIND